VGAFGLGKGERSRDNELGETIVTWILAALQIALASVLFLAAIGKALRSDEFTAALRLSHIPTPLVTPVAIVVPLVEASLAALLVLAPVRWLPATLTATLVLFLLFTLWMASVRMRRLRIRCGCFGPGGADVGPQTIGRNALFVLAALVALLLVRQGATLLPGPSFAMVVAVTSLAMSLALLDALRTAWPHLAVTFDRLHPHEAPQPGGD